MNRRVLGILGFAAVFASCLSYIAYWAFGTRGAAGYQPPAAEVMVASRDLDVGTLIGSHDVNAVKWFGALPKGIATKPDAVLNRGVLSKIYEGELILAGRLSSPGAGGGLVSTIPPGMRACPVKVNEVVGAAGFVIPGTRVDVLLSGVPPGAAPGSGPRVRTLLQNIEVLSAGTNIQRDNEGKPQQVQVVNLLVTPAQAESLSLAGSEAHLQLVLRNPMDTEIGKPPGTAMAQLFEGTATPPSERPASIKRKPAIEEPASRALLAPAAAPLARTIEVINGLTRTEASFSRTEERP